MEKDDKPGHMLASDPAALPDVWLRLDMPLLELIALQTALCVFMSITSPEDPGGDQLFAAMRSAQENIQNQLDHGRIRKYHWWSRKR